MRHERSPDHAAPNSTDDPEDLWRNTVNQRPASVARPIGSLQKALDRLRVVADEVLEHRKRGPISDQPAGLS